jgi:ribosome-associated protein
MILGEPFETTLAAAVRSLGARKAEDLVVLDLRGKSSFTDCFVICHGSSDRQLKALAEAVIDDTRQATGRKPLKAEGTPRSGWMLVDYGDFVVHLFSEEARAYYRLEQLWGDAVQLPLGRFGLDEPA